MKTPYSSAYRFSEGWSSAPLDCRQPDRLSALERIFRKLMAKLLRL